MNCHDACEGDALRAAVVELGKIAYQIELQGARAAADITIAIAATAEIPSHAAAFATMVASVNVLLRQALVHRHLHGHMQDVVDVSGEKAAAIGPLVEDILTVLAGTLEAKDPGATYVIRIARRGAKRDA